MSVEAPSKWFSTSSPDREWDYVIVGSGMGGMATASLLAQIGRRVLVLEQHYVPGGFTHAFRRKRWTWDVGVHAVGETSDRSSVGRVLSRLAGGRLEWASLGPVYDSFQFPDGFAIDFPDSARQFRENLVAAFPDEADPIDRYFALVREVAGSMRSYYAARALPPGLAGAADLVLARGAKKYLTQRTTDVLNGLTSNDRLRTVLAAQWGYYGSPPSRSSFAIHALVAKHFWYGGTYPVGGAKRIAETMLGTVAEANGWTRIRADVQEILVEKGRATGVRLASGEVIRAKNVVSAAGARATVDKLLPEKERSARWARSIAALPQSPAHVCLNIGFKGDIRAAGAGARNLWFYETWNHESKVWDINDPGSRAPVLYTSFPSLKDPHHEPGPEQLHTGEVVTFVPLSDFTRWEGSRWMKRGDAYDALKQELTDRLLAQFLEYMPALKPLVAHAELSTPLSTLHFTRAPGGAIYGLEPTPERYSNPWLRPRTPIPNLFLSGADMATVGVMGAFVGGVLAAVSAEPRRGLAFLRSSVKR